MKKFVKFGFITAGYIGASVFAWGILGKRYNELIDKYCADDDPDC